MVKRTWNERHWTEAETDTLDIDEGWALDSFEDHDVEREVTHDTHGRTQARRRLSSIGRFTLTGVATMDRISQRWHSRLGRRAQTVGEKIRDEYRHRRDRRWLTL